MMISIFYTRRQQGQLHATYGVCVTPPFNDNELGFVLQKALI